MANIIETLEQITPLIIIAGLALFMTLETAFPYIRQSSQRKKQKWHNLGNVFVSFIFNAALSGVIASSIIYADRSGFGLMHWLPLPSPARFVAGILLCDLNSYVAHRLYHRIPVFWRFHRVHHSDTELDATSALRLHPFEFMFQAFTQATVLPLLGVSFASYVVYFMIALPIFIINHANLRYAPWFDKIFGLIFITPDRHRVHHSSRQVETDSNFADVFSFWDRLFGTYRSADPKSIRFGLEDQREPREQTLIEQLRTPFRKF